MDTDTRINRDFLSETRMWCCFYYSFHLSHLIRLIFYVFFRFGDAQNWKFALSWSIRILFNFSDMNIFISFISFRKFCLGVFCTYIQMYFKTNRFLFNSRTSQTNRARSFEPTCFSRSPKKIANWQIWCIWQSVMYAMVLTLIQLQQGSSHAIVQFEILPKLT